MRAFTVELIHQPFQRIVGPTALFAVFERLTQGGPFCLMPFQKHQSGQADPFDAAHHAQGGHQRSGIAALGIVIEEDCDVIVPFLGMVAKILLFNLVDCSRAAPGFDAPSMRP